MMRSIVDVIGVSREEDQLIRALDRLRQKGYGNVKTFSPIPGEKLVERAGIAPSPVRYYTLAGGILGFAAGMGITVWTALRAPFIVGGKPVVSIPPFLVIAFELTMLFAGLFTVAGLVIHARLMRPIRKVGSSHYDVRFSTDRFGILVSCDGGQAEEVKQLIEAVGMEEVSVQHND